MTETGLTGKIERQARCLPTYLYVSRVTNAKPLLRNLSKLVQLALNKNPETKEAARNGGTDWSKKNE